MKGIIPWKGGRVAWGEGLGGLLRRLQVLMAHL